MPIGAFEREILRVLAANRNPDSYVGGATILHQAADSPRASRDVDLFHDTTESLERAVECDTKLLQSRGYETLLEKPQGSFQRAQIKRGDHLTKIEWVYDSSFRFFPVEKDEEMGWRLSFWDAATNKILALFGRHEFRDYVDALFLHTRHLHLGALIWAAAGKDPGLTPELILEWMKRNAIYSRDEVKTVDTGNRLDLVALRRQWLAALAESESLVARLPAAEMGCFYLDVRGQPVCPDPASPDFALRTRHFGSVKGAWPRIAGQ
jgi:hypothetical protein